MFWVLLSGAVEHGEGGAAVVRPCAKEGYDGEVLEVGGLLAAATARGHQEMDGQAASQARIGQNQNSIAPPRTKPVLFWGSGTTTIELTYRTDLSQSSIYGAAATTRYARIGVFVCGVGGV